MCKICFIKPFVRKVVQKKVCKRNLHFNVHDLCMRPSEAFFTKVVTKTCACDYSPFYIQIGRWFIGKRRQSGAFTEKGFVHSQNQQRSNIDHIGSNSSPSDGSTSLLEKHV